MKDLENIDVIGEVKVIKSSHFTAWEYKRLSPIHGEILETKIIFHSMILDKTEHDIDNTHLTLSTITSKTVRQLPTEVTFKKTKGK